MLDGEILGIVEDGQGFLRNVVGFRGRTAIGC